MSVLGRIAFFRNRRDEVPNQELAKELAKTRNEQGIKEIAENLWNKNKSVQSDCLKVLYEIGYTNPELISEYVDDFLKLLKSNNNRMVWGGMIALATIAEKRSGRIWENIDDVIKTTERGSLITVVWGIKTLARVASVDNRYRNKIFPILIKHLKKCIPRDVPMHAESILLAVDESNKRKFLSILGSRRRELKPSQFAKIRSILKKLGEE
nr:hypothetical protein [Candidatus Njordarchaeum guaymaensis]